MEEDVTVESGEPEAGTPPVDGGVPDASETPSVDAAGAEGDEPEGEGAVEDELLRFAKSRGHESLDDVKARNDIGSLLGRTLTQNKTLSEKLAQLERQLAERDTPARPAEPEPDPEPPPDLKAVDDYIGSLKAELDAYGTAEAETFQSYLNKRQEIAVLEDRVDRADDLDKPGFQRELQIAKRELSLIDNQMKSLPRDKQRTEAELRRATRERQSVADRLESEERARHEADQRQKAQSQEFVSNYERLIPAIANELKVTQDTKLRASMAKYVRACVIEELFQHAEENIQNVDVAGLVRKHMKDWAEERKLIEAAQLNQDSRRTLVNQTPVTPAARKAPPRNPASEKLDPYEQMERAEAARKARLNSLTGM